MKSIALLLAAAAAFGADPPVKVRLPTSRADLENGEKLYQANCALCHGTKGDGGRGAVLAGRKLARAADDAALVKVIEEGVRGTEMPGAWQLSAREGRQVAAFVRSLSRVSSKPVPGDANHGAELYAQNHCSACHAIRGLGGSAGPDLSDTGLRRNPAFLRTSLTDPEAELPRSYQLVSIRTNSGSAITGARLNEDSFSIQVRDSSGKVHSLWKHEIAELKKERGKSAMPSYKQLSSADLDDLVAYLSSLKEAS
ncbi:MAG: c-type cytochrome [Bryobacterales bacterium]|nr:c-type cytochrome [Bryobacterales bacterium]